MNVQISATTANFVVDNDQSRFHKSPRVSKAVNSAQGRHEQNWHYHCSNVDWHTKKGQIDRRLRQTRSNEYEYLWVSPS